MLQDTLRSAVYRSLTKPPPVKKDNGDRHLVDHETNGTSRSSGPAELNSPSRGGSRGPRGLMEEEEEEEEEGQLRLFRASEGARDLTRMINSLSRAPHLDGRSKHVARDLLEGARGLQSSLAALAKRQEAPKRRTEAAELVEEAKVWRRYGLQERHLHSVDGSARSLDGEHKKISSKQRLELMDEKTLAPKRFRSRKPDFSVNGWSRYGPEEARRVSRLRFKQRMEYMEEEIGVHDDGESRRTSTFKLREVSEYFEEEVGFEETRLPTESSRELRRVITDSLCRQNLLPPVAATLRPRRARGPNVVARLMGLDEAPSPRRGDQERKKSLQVAPRPAFDIEDRPKARKAQTWPERPDPTGRGTLHEIAAAMQFNGLLGNGRGDASRFEKLIGSFREEEDAPPPIVIMKPLCKDVRRSLPPDKISAEEETKSADSNAEAAKRKKASKSIKRTDTNIKNDERKRRGDGKRNNPHEGIDSSSTSRTSTSRDRVTNRAVAVFATGRAASELEDDLTCLLLGSRSFIDRAKELFRIDARQPVRYGRRKGVGEDVMRNAKLYLDCGKELMARKSSDSTLQGSTRCRSLGQLAEEVSRGIELLRSCSGSEGDLYQRLERDLRGKEMMASANWDTGWDTSIGTEDATRVVDELEVLVTSWLIAEVSQDLVWL